jgi:hypothetical protein
MHGEKGKIIRRATRRRPRRLSRAAYVVQLQTTLNRVTGVPMELRTALGAYDEAAAQFTVYTSAGGGVIRQRDDIAGAPRRPPDRLI